MDQRKEAQIMYVHKINYKVKHRQPTLTIFHIEILTWKSSLPVPLSETVTFHASFK